MCKNTSKIEAVLTQLNYLAGNGSHLRLNAATKSRQEFNPERCWRESDEHQQFDLIK